MSWCMTLSKERNARSPAKEHRQEVLHIFYCIVQRHHGTPLHHLRLSFRWLRNCEQTVEHGGRASQDTAVDFEPGVLDGQDDVTVLKPENGAFDNLVWTRRG